MAVSEGQMYAMKFLSYYSRRDISSDLITINHIITSIDD